MATRPERSKSFMSVPPSRSACIADGGNLEQRRSLITSYGIASGAGASISDSRVRGAPAGLTARVRMRVAAAARPPPFFLSLFGEIAGEYGRPWSARHLPRGRQRRACFWAFLTSANRLCSPSLMPSSVATWSRRASSSHCLRMAVFSAWSRSWQSTTSAGYLNTLLGLVSAFFLSSLAIMAASVWWNSRQRLGHRAKFRGATSCSVAPARRYPSTIRLGGVAIDQIEQVVGQGLARDLVIHRVQLLLQPHIEWTLGRTLSRSAAGPNRRPGPLRGLSSSRHDVLPRERKTIPRAPVRAIDLSPTNYP